MSEFSLGAQLYTVREYTTTPADIETTFRRVAEIGYQSAQASGMGPIDAAELARISRETGVAVAVTHTSPDRLFNDLDAVMKEHETYGCRIVGMGGLPNEMRDTSEHLYEAIERLDVLSRRLHENGFTFGYHNHTWEFAKLDGKAILQHMLERTDPAAFKLILDAYWVHHAGVDPVKFIERYADRLCVLHLKDMAAVSSMSNDVEFAEIGYGKMDYPAIVEAGKRAGCKWYMVEQDVCKRDPFESLQMSYEYITKNGLL